MGQKRVIMPDRTSRYIPMCKICDNPGRARLIEADWAAGRSATVIAKDMTDSGWPLVAETIRRHLKHVPGARTRENEPMPTVPQTKRTADGVEFVKGRLLDAIIAKERRLRVEAEQSGEEFDGEFLLDKDLQPALNTVLKAEGIKIKREEAASKRQIGLFMLMLGKNGGKAPTALIGDGSIEGEAKDVTPRTPAEQRLYDMGVGAYEDDGKEYDDEEDEDGEDGPAAE